MYSHNILRSGYTVYKGMAMYIPECETRGKDSEVVAGHDEAIVGHMKAPRRTPIDRLIRVARQLLFVYIYCMR